MSIILKFYLKAKPKTKSFKNKKTNEGALNEPCRNILIPVFEREPTEGYKRATFIKKNSMANYC